ncbi:hypothetical protein [Mucilaginibacter lappiensis]|uniref:Tetratricopeptide (TPR) repeat protein n=1 Tax=Mucilaginibacter lappiensis TaxID=354630 RepID=A0A841JD27_9SPHI|nr:hypothetical protein [Mucilaginibacter lappiensis]MBB6127496.1 tetratricopeptide (TPR) repeat protein [Mucilaginibacter lappiensis]
MSYTELKSINEQWANITEQGNQLFDKKQYHDAFRCYEEAMVLGEVLFGNVQDAEHYQIQVIPVFSVSCINLANLYRTLKEISKAGDYFFYNVWNLKMLSWRNDISKELYIEAIKNWQQAVLNLTLFYQETGQALMVDFWKDNTYKQIQFSKEWLNSNKTRLN